MHALNWHKVCVHSNQSVIFIESLVGSGLCSALGIWYMIRHNVLYGAYNLAEK